MPLTITKTPPDYLSAHGDIIYNSYNATHYMDAGYKYVADIWIDGVIQSRQFAFPNPEDNKGIFNIGSVVRNYVKCKLTATAGVLVQQFGNTEYNCNVVVKFGEEFGGTTYINVVNDTNRVFFNHYNGRLIGRYTILGDYLDTFATTYSGTRLTTADSKFQMIPFFVITEGDVTIEINGYDSSGSLYVNATDTLATVVANTLLQLNLSQIALSGIISTIVDAAVSYYTVTINGQIIRYDVYCESVYKSRSVTFLNKIGGFETYEFSKLSKSKMTLEKKDYGKIQYNNDGVTFANGIMNDSSNTYAVNFNEKILLNSDLIREDKYKWLAQLVLSPNIYLFEDEYLIPVRVSETDYEFKTRTNDKVFNLSVNFEYTETSNTQFL